MSHFNTKLHQIQFWLGLCPDPTGAVYSAPPDSQAGFKGPTSKEGDRKGKKGR